jgi:hypothetical protein
MNSRSRGNQIEEHKKHALGDNNTIGSDYWSCPWPHPDHSQNQTVDTLAQSRRHRCDMNQGADIFLSVRKPVDILWQCNVVDPLRFRFTSKSSGIQRAGKTDCRAAQAKTEQNQRFGRWIRSITGTPYTRTVLARLSVAG